VGKFKGHNVEGLRGRPKLLYLLGYSFCYADCGTVASLGGTDCIWRTWCPSLSHRLLCDDTSYWRSLWILAHGYYQSLSRTCEVL